MKTTEGKKERDKGAGNKAKLTIDAHLSTDINGEKSDFKLNTTITVDHLDYFLENIIGGLAQFAEDLTKDGISKNHLDSRSRKSATV